MGKNRGNRGNNNNGGNSRGNNNNNNNNNNRGNQGGGNGGSKYCKFCEKQVTSHDSSTCNKNPSRKTNNNDKVNKNQKNNNNNNNNKNNNNNQNNQNNSNPCTTCGLKGHQRSTCTALQVPDADKCGCGCEYHRSHQCPWSTDPLTRLEYINKVTGKICQWCKDTGNGEHVFSECKEPPKFRAELQNIINREYDKLPWCWHCSREDHRTSACDDDNASAPGKSKWLAIINNIIQSWVKNDPMGYGGRYSDDVPMVGAARSGGPGAGNSPPVSAGYLWCICCEDFGHLKDCNTKPCDKTVYTSKCPARYLNGVDHVAVPFNPYGNQNIVGNQYNVHAGGPSVTTNCPHCRRKVGPWIIPCPKSGQTIYCSSCGTLNSHPAAPPRRESGETIDKFLEVVRIMNGGGSGTQAHGKKSKKQRVDEMTINPYAKRPSMALPKRLAIKNWPDVQPIYDDLMWKKNKSPLFKSYDGLSYFNIPGNHQIYFPATKFRINAAMMDDALDPTFWINKAGRLGMEYMCLTCRTRGLVADDERDVVMCGTEPMNTVGMGTGSYLVFVDDKGNHRDRCQCLAIIGQRPQLEWVQVR